MPSTDPNETIAFQGIAGAHSDMACKQAYPYMHTLPCESFSETIAAVEEGKARYALIPIENSEAGRVAEIHNLLPDTKLSIVGEYFHRVHHHLLGIKGTKKEAVKEVYSHPQALMQCRKSCEALKLKREPFMDTAAAAEAVANWADPSKAALASHLAAELYGLEVLQEHMEDSDSNTTLFLTLAEEPLDLAPDAPETLLTSMLFTTRHLSAGLYKALGGFATNGVNLVKLESYIPDYATGTAQFFITFEGHPQEPTVQQALEELGFFTQKATLLGVYPADQQSRTT